MRTHHILIYFLAHPYSSIRVCRAEFREFRLVRHPRVALRPARSPVISASSYGLEVELRVRRRGSARGCEFLRGIERRAESELRVKRGSPGGCEILRMSGWGMAFPV